MWLSRARKSAKTAGRLCLLCSILTFCGAARQARANDGGISFGGSPRLLTGHPSVSMQSEIVRMRIGEEKVTVDCTFIFQNQGPACTVRMGFPDQGQGADDPDEEGVHNPPTSAFDTFKSYVNGKPISTKLVRSQQSIFWHTKTVSFPANSHVVIRDVYTTSVGAHIEEKGSVHLANYILHTGASWHGPIGRSEVIITFQSKHISAPLRPVPVHYAPEVVRRQYLVNKKIETTDWNKVTGRVYYVGPCAPTAHGNSLRFVRTNWRPTERDDIYLAF
jgi:hypothetical protein